MLILGLLFASALPAVAQSGPLQASWLGQSYILQSAGEEITLEISDDSSVQLPTPKGVRYSSLKALQDGWIAVGDFDADDGAHRLFLVRGEGTSFELHYPPRNQRKRSRQDAVLLTENGELVGLAWLEGDTRRSLDVRFSEWNGNRWRSPKRVAPRARGSQMALSGAVLEDGSWLLLWSAFDGNDDEIVWTVRKNRHWQAPRQLGSANGVPDITPAVAACGDGAIAAWSRYDGQDYRLLLTVFDGEAWHQETLLPGAGSLHPVFHPPEDFSGTPNAGPNLLFREASVQGWTALGLDENGTVVSRTSAEGTPKDRPVLSSQEGELHFRWPQREQEHNLSGQGMAGQAEP